MLGVPRPQPPPPPPSETNGKFNISDIYPQDGSSDVDLSDSSELEKYRHESDEDEEEGESRYRMRSSRQPPAKRRKVDLYEEYVTDDDHDD
jgi:hypothetical protein